MRIQLIIIISVFSISFCQEEIRPWEKLGISQTEWMMIQNNQLPMSKVGELLRDGIGISEYFDKPWVELGISESKWISKRRSGLTNEDIVNKIRRPKKDDSWKDRNREIIRDDFKAVSKSGQRFSALFLPGYQQHKKNRKISGNIFIGLSTCSIIWCGISSIERKQFYSLPIFSILIPTMVGSLIEFSIHSNKDNKGNIE